MAVGSALDFLAADGCFPSLSLAGFFLAVDFLGGLCLVMEDFLDGGFAPASGAQAFFFLAGM